MERPGSARCAIWASIQAHSSSMLEAMSAWVGVAMNGDHIECMAVFRMQY